VAMPAQATGLADAWAGNRFRVLHVGGRGTRRCPVAGRAGRLTVRIVDGSSSPAHRFRAIHDRQRYAFTDCEATTAAGVPLRIPAGVHHVERRSLVFRVRLGGRELDLTLADWERLLHAGCVGPISVVVADSQVTGDTLPR
jgi:hypothetical protein